MPRSLLASFTDSISLKNTDPRLCFDQHPLLLFHGTYKATETIHGIRDFEGVFGLIMECGKATKLGERCKLFDWNNGEIIGLKKMFATP